MAASIRLLFPYIPVMVATISFSAFIILSEVFVPYKKHIESTPAFAVMFVAIFGSTTSPYLFVWQASEEAEDVEKHKIKEIGKGNPKISKKETKSMRQDTAIGMAAK